LAGTSSTITGDIATRLCDMTATHDFEKFRQHMRRDRGSQRPAMTVEQRHRLPPAVHPVLLTHPITGRKVLYCNPGFTLRINELSDPDSEAMLPIPVR
jgi:taurine dioxygenase